jgi:hypothetical protein
MPRSHGKCTPALAGSRIACRLAATSHIGESAKRVRARSSTVNVKRTM